MNQAKINLYFIQESDGYKEILLCSGGCLEVESWAKPDSGMEKCLLGLLKDLMLLS